MSHKYSVGTQFETPDGRVEIVDTFVRNDNGEERLMYDVKYLDRVGSPQTPEHESFLDDCRQL